MTLSNKIAIVTGGATGMGAASSRILAANGAHVWVVSHLPVDAMQPFCDEIRKAGGSATAATCDVTDRTAIARLFERIEQEHGRLDILVNCAGVFYITPLSNTHPHEIDHMFAVNVTGPMEMIRLAVPLMRKGGFGSIINITSAAAIIGFTTTAAYSASKAALTHFTRTIAPELKGTGVRVNTIAPGSVRTPMSGFPDDKAPFTPEQERAMEKRVAVSNSPYGNGMMAPDDIAEAVLFLASDAGRGFHGACLVADQGITTAMAPGRDLPE